MTEEIPLTGGNTTVVTRVGDTVRRPSGHWTPAVHDLLRHLDDGGFDGAPRVLGHDDRHREMLQFIPGEVGTLSDDDPLPAWFTTPEACRAIGRWIADFQRAQRDFTADRSKPWRTAQGDADGEVLVHHDVSPYNTVRRADGSLVVLDWDFTRPGNSLEDLAWAAWMWAPLKAGEAWHRTYSMGPDEDVTERQVANLRALLDGYRPSPEQRALLVDEIGRQMSSHADDLELLAESDSAFADLIERGFATLARQDAAWWPSSRVRREVFR